MHVSVCLPVRSTLAALIFQLQGGTKWLLDSRNRLTHSFRYTHTHRDRHDDTQMPVKNALTHTLVAREGSRLLLKIDWLSYYHFPPLRSNCVQHVGFGKWKRWMKTSAVVLKQRRAEITWMKWSGNAADKTLSRHFISERWSQDRVERRTETRALPRLAFIRFFTKVLIPLQVC